MAKATPNVQPSSGKASEHDRVDEAPQAMRIAEPGWRGEARAIGIVWQRELIQFSRNRLRIATVLVQPLLFLFILGTGLSRLTGSSTHGLNFRTFVYPGILAMSVLFTAMFSAASIVWDREFGFLREMMVAPVARSSIVLGKCFGGATVATVQGAIVLCLAGLVHVPYNFTLIIEILAIQMALAFAVTAFGVMVAARISQMQSFMAVTQMMIMPMFFISGALYPLNHLPGWLTVLNRIDPLTYAVQPMRHIIFDHLNISPLARKSLDPSLTWWSWRVPTGVEIAVILVLGMIMLSVAIFEFSRE